jgi:dipeptidyl aminopeptidase/acylaminoacyl peptidase
LELTRLFDQVPAIKDVVLSPLGEAIYLNCWLHDDMVYYRETSVYAIEFNPPVAMQEFLRRESEKVQKPTTTMPAAEKSPADEKEDVSYLGSITHLNTPHAARLLKVSPDGRQLLFSYQGRDDKMYTISELWVIDRQTAFDAASLDQFVSSLHNCSAVLDEEALDVVWVKAGLFASYPERTVVNLAHLDLEGGSEDLDLAGFPLRYSFDVADNGSLAWIGSNTTSFPEVYFIAPGKAGQSQRLTDFGAALAEWELGTVETIRWQSRDGAEIEGVLRKPANFDPTKKYPLVFVVHGGPASFSAAYQATGEELAYYPVIQFLGKDVLVLKPNYRGSTGRGQAFMELNVNNLGVGDLWDLESAIDYLDSLGWVDPERVGCMGWSQGGYISAFAGLHSDRFKAVSVGAGISDWYTYHISNDIPDFTTDYLSGSPFRGRELYNQTAPISSLANAKTPMLIQHGAEDHRVPLSNATELFRGLKEMGVPVELFIFPGMAHPITKPRENHAVMHQNLAWFSH